MTVLNKLIYPVIHSTITEIMDFRGMYPIVIAPGRMKIEGEKTHTHSKVSSWCPKTCRPEVWWFVPTKGISESQWQSRTFRKIASVGDRGIIHGLEGHRLALPFLLIQTAFCYVGQCTHGLSCLVLHLQETIKSIELIQSEHGDCVSGHDYSC